MCTGAEIAMIGATVLGSVASSASKPKAPTPVAAPKLQTPAQAATARKQDTGAQVRIGADAASKARRNSKGSSDSTTTKKQGNTGLNLGSGSGALL